jgi:hypothetical protein
MYLQEHYKEYVFYHNQLINILDVSKPSSLSKQLAKVKVYTYTVCSTMY